MDTIQSFIGTLRETRSNLSQALLSAEGLQRKLIGPRPSSPEKLPQGPPDCVASLIVEINTLSTQLQKALAGHHDTIGEFSKDQEAAATRYA